MKDSLTAADPQGWYECQRVIDTDPELKQVVWWNGETIEVRRGCFPHHPVDYYREYRRLFDSPIVIVDHGDGMVTYRGGFWLKDDPVIAYLLAERNIRP